MSMLAAGNYWGKLTTLELLSRERKDGSGESTRFEAKFSIDQYYADNAWQDIEAIERTVYIYLSVDARPISMLKLRGLGFDVEPDFVNALQDPGNTEVAARKTGLCLGCKHRSYNGKPKEEWEVPFDRDGTAGGEVSSDVLAVLKSWWTDSSSKPAKSAPIQAAAASIPPPSPSPPSPPSPPPPPPSVTDAAALPPPEDDMPF